MSGKHFLSRLSGMALFALCLLALSCGGKDRRGEGATIEECEPANSCSCEPGVERDTLCRCSGGSECEIDGDGIEFQCDGNAGCGMTCGTDCLITCPGTTTCDVDVGNGAEISCPGTATCNVTCHGSCQLSMAGAARSVLICNDAAADCQMGGCNPTDCGDGVFACGTSCPEG